MDGWKDRTKSGRKESGFAILKTRFQDCNLSRKQESKLSGWNENGLPVKLDGKFSANQKNSPSAKIESKANSRKTRKKANKTDLLLATLLAIWNESKLSICTDGNQ